MTAVLNRNFTATVSKAYTVHGSVLACFPTRQIQDNNKFHVMMETVQGQGVEVWLSSALSRFVGSSDELILHISWQYTKVQ